MERNEQFTVLAEYYDRLNGADYKAYAEFVQRIFKRYGTGEQSLVLDLGCGTGSLTMALAELGYDMIGADISPEMLTVALDRAYDSGKSILYLNQDMRSFELYGTVDGIVCALDGINYLTKREDVLKTLRLVRNYLNPEALFIFDVNSEYRFKEIFAKRDFFLEDDGVYMGWHSDFDEKSGICTFDLTLFAENEDGTYTRHEEEQSEKLWTDGELKQLIDEAELELVDIFADFDMKKAHKTDEKRFYVARCPKIK